MLKKILLIGMMLLLFSPLVSTQETFFGKNKVRYKEFDWQYISDKHFDVYFYEDGLETAKFAAAVLESSYVEISNELMYEIQNPIPVFVYNSHNDFQQTNIISSIIPEGVGGFTEAFKNRIVIPFSGSYEEFRHVLHHELTHGVVYDLIYGKAFSSLLSKGRLFNLPLWYAEGYAEYSSRHGWDYFSDMFVRDATINSYLTPPMYLGGFLAYKQGQAMVKYIADKYGEDKLGLLLKKGRVVLTMNKALKQVLDITEKELWEDFSKEMKRQYWPEIAIRKEADEIGKQLTKARKDGSYFNEKPVFHPHGDALAFFTDRSDYTEVIMISPEDGKKIRSLIKGHRSGDLESLHSFVSGVSFSPDGEKMVLVAKSGGEATLIFYDLIKDKIYERKHDNFYNITSPAWSPDGSKIAFAGLKTYKRDIYIYDIAADKFERFTHDLSDDKDPSWSADSKQLFFTSDRPHPDWSTPTWNNNLYSSQGAFLPGGFEYGYYNIFYKSLGDEKIIPLDLGEGQNSVPRISPDGEKIAFISNRNGIDNIYIGYLDSSKVFPITDILTGVRSLSWSPNGKKIAFSAFNKGAFDIFIINEIKPASENGMLTVTDFVAGKYNLLKKEIEADPAIIAFDSIIDSSLTMFDSAAEYESYQLDTAMLAQLADSITADTTAGDTLLTASEIDKDSIVEETGIYDEGFVFVSEGERSVSFDSLFSDVPGADSTRPLNEKPDPAEIFDERLSSDDGTYEINPYKSKLTLDYFNAYGGYNTFYGLQGQSFFVLSDYLGNHQVYIITDLINTIDQSNIFVQYIYNKHRTSYGVGIFHTKYFYEDNGGFLFSDRIYSVSGYMSYPFSTFKRLDLELSQVFVDREYLDFDDLRDKRNSKITTAGISFVADNVIWGLTGPVNGRRAKVSVSSAINFFDSNDLEFTSVEFDYRRYWHFNKSVSFAFRVSGGASFGRTPKQYYLGGTTNWIGTRTYSDDIYELENLHFRKVVTPLRGYPYNSLTGDRYGLINTELRFPLIDYFIMRYPLPLAFTRVQGAIFADIGSAWYDDDFKGAVSSDPDFRLRDIKFGFGTGMRLNLGIFLLRYDLAWQTDLDYVSDHPSHYFSFGADF